MWQKCKRLSCKTRDKWNTMLVTLSDCCMEYESKFCQMISTRGTLQQNMCQGWWAVIKRNYALLSALRWKRPQVYFQHQHWWWIWGVWVQTWDKAAAIAVEDSNFNVTKVSTSSEQCQINVDFFLTLKASSIRNLIHQNRRRLKNSIATVWGNWGKISGTNIQTSGATIPRHGIITMLWLTCCSLCSSF